MNDAAIDTTAGPDFSKAISLLGGLTVSNRKCAFGRLLEEAPPEFTAAYESAVENGVATRLIHAELQKAGMRIGRDTISLHRNSRCICVGESNG